MGFEWIEQLDVLTCIAANGFGDRLREFQKRSREGRDSLARSLELGIAALVKVYETPTTPEWSKAITRLA